MSRLAGESKKRSKFEFCKWLSDKEIGKSASILSTCTPGFFGFWGVLSRKSLHLNEIRQKVDKINISNIGV